MAAQRGLLAWICEYYLIDSKNPKVQGLDGAVRSHVEFLYDLAAS